MNKLITYLFLSASFCALCFASCGEAPPMDLNPKQKAMIDTLYRRSTKILRPELDSICETLFEKRVKLAVDSILELRLKEKEALLKRGN